MTDDSPTDDGATFPALPGPLPGATAPRATDYSYYGAPFQFQFQVGISTHTSQLPSGPDLQQIESYCPGATNRLIAMQEQLGNMVEREQVFQHEMGRANSRRKTNSQRYAFATFLICMAITIWAASTGRGKLATVVGGTTVVAVVAIFVTGRLLRAPDDETAEGGDDTPD